MGRLARNEPTGSSAQGEPSGYGDGLLSKGRFSITLARCLLRFQLNFCRKRLRFLRLVQLGAPWQIKPSPTVREGPLENQEHPSSVEGPVAISTYDTQGSVDLVQKQAGHTSPDLETMITRRKNQDHFSLTFRDQRRFIPKQSRFPTNRF